MKKIELTNGMFALVDDEDYFRVSQYKWLGVKFLEGKYYAKNHKHGLLSKFLLKTNPDEEFIVNFLNGDTLDYRKENLVKSQTTIKSSKYEVVKKRVQLTLDLDSTGETAVKNVIEPKSGVFKKIVFEAKHVDESGRVFHFGTFDNFKEAKESYERNMKILCE